MIPQKLTVLFVYSAPGRVLVEPYGLSAPIINGGIFELYSATPTGIRFFCIPPCSIFAVRDPHSLPSSRHQMLYAEQVFWIRPKLLDGPPRSCRQARELLNGVFVGIFRHDLFSRSKCNLRAI
jgi:hypothetical protein